MIVRVPALLSSYTGSTRTVHLDVDSNATLDRVLRQLDHRYPGLRFRIVDEQDCVRPHIKIFIDGTLTRELAAPVADDAELMIVGALSGG